VLTLTHMITFVEDLSETQARHRKFYITYHRFPTEQRLAVVMGLKNVYLPVRRIKYLVSWPKDGIIIYDIYNKQGMNGIHDPGSTINIYITIGNNETHTRG
jgi:hypothetical protein